MTPSICRLSCTPALLLPAVAAARSPPIKPGLWEVRSENCARGRPASQPAGGLQRLPPVASQRTVHGRWFGADCGVLKPFDLKR